MPVAVKQPGVGPPQYSSSLVEVGRLVFDKAVAPEVVLHVVSPQSVGGFADVGFLLEVLVVVSSNCSGQHVQVALLAWVVFCLFPLVLCLGNAFLGAVGEVLEMFPHAG